MAKRNYLYKNIEIVPYSNGYRPYYRHADGTRELLAVLCLTSKMAKFVGKAEVDYMNGKETMERE